MFFIFGWNKPEVSSYGSVHEHTCPNCNNSEYWQLQKISYYFTLFFIPVFPHSRKYWYHCPVCNRGIELDSNAAKHYMVIADANAAYVNKTITEEEWLSRIEESNSAISQLEKQREAQHEIQEKQNQIRYLKESENFQATASQKTDEELLSISGGNPDKYSPAFLIAVKQEMKQRNLVPDAEDTEKDG